MGKVRKLRQKYHLSLKKSESSKNLAEVQEQEKLDETKNNLLMTSQKNIFDGINISLDDLNKSLPADFDVRSVISTKSRKEIKEEERHLKKNEKKKLRHERFLMKLDIAQQLLKNAKLKKNKQKKSIHGNFSSPLEALLSLQSLEMGSQRCDKPKAKLRGTLKAKHRLKQQNVDMKIFKQILNDKKFKHNPIQAINQYLKQNIDKES